MHVLFLTPEHQRETWHYIVTSVCLTSAPRHPLVNLDSSCVVVVAVSCNSTVILKQSH